MKFEKLGPKEPDFNERVIFMLEDGSWFPGELKSKTTTSDEVNYTVKTEDETERNILNPKYFMKITPPKEKE